MIASLALALLSFAPLQNKPEEIKFTTEDGVTIYGLLNKTNMPEGKPAVICIPMFNHFKGDYRQSVISFAAQGITALAIDPRGHGSSIKGAQGEDLGEKVRKKDPAIFMLMHKDVEAAIKYLVETVKVSPEKIGLLGASVGSSIAIHTASLDEKIAAVACLTPGESYMGMPTMEHLKNFSRPLYLVTAKDEEAKGTKQILEAMKGNPKVEKFIVDVEGAHGTNLFNKRDIQSFLSTWFLKQFNNVGKTPVKK